MLFAKTEERNNFGRGLLKLEFLKIYYLRETNQINRKIFENC